MSQTDESVLSVVILFMTKGAKHLPSNMHNIVLNNFMVLAGIIRGASQC